MKKYTMQEIINENKVVKCSTIPECKKLIAHYVDNFNGDDDYYDVNNHDNPEYYDLGNEMCVELSHAKWCYASFSFYKGKNDIIEFSQVDFEEEPIRRRGFEVVEKRKNEGVEIILPKRGTSESMAYDFFSPKSYTVEPNEIVKIWTDVKAYMQSGEGLILNVRSSMGGKFMIANTQGWIEPDYYNNESNEGNIGFFLKNISDKTIVIEQGERIGQGMFIPFLVSDNGNPEEEVKRTGGFGSTGK